MQFSLRGINVSLLKPEFADERKEIFAILLHQLNWQKEILIGSLEFHLIQVSEH